MKEKTINYQLFIELIKPGIFLIFQALVAGVVISTILTMIILSVSSAQADELLLNEKSLNKESFENPEDVGQGSLLIQKNNHEYVPVDLLSTQVDISVNGLISRTKVTQIFSNQYEDNIEAIYVFPLPENSTIEKFTLIIGDEVIKGKIMEKKVAEHVYQQAKKAGKQSAVMKQQRPNIFKTKVANITKGSEVSVIIEYQRRINFSELGYELRFPLVVGPRYTPSDYYNLKPDKVLEEEIDIRSASQISQNDSQVTQSLYLIPPDSETNQIMNPVNIHVKLNAGFEIESINSPSHAIIFNNENTLENKQSVQHRSWDYSVTLKDRQVPANKDFILQWQLKKSDYPRAALFSEQDKASVDSPVNTFYINMMIMPPEELFQDEQRLSKEMILVLDTSGSMGGTSIKQARKAMLKLLKSMHAGDSFNIIEFNSDYESLFSFAVPVNRHNIKKAINYVSQLQAKGGTEMIPPLRAALSSTKIPFDSSLKKQLKQIVFITDGNVTNEAELFSIIKNRLGDSHLFTVGIGSAPNSYFMRKAAEMGRGSFTYIAHVDEVEQKMQALFKQLESPLLAGLHITWPDEFKQIAMYPERLNDLYLGQPILVNAKVTVQGDTEQQYKLLIEGQGGMTQWKSHLMINAQANHRGVANLWARKKISALMDLYHHSSVSNRQSEEEHGQEELKQKVIDVSLKHQIISPFTSFVAVSNKPLVSEQKKIKRLKVPLHLPEGWTLNVYPATATIGPLLQQTGLMLVLMSLLLLSCLKLVKYMNTGRFFW
ncbi:MAG: marine proteobacterial sortase target protein [gamma proteobacterium symbiont of Taylorina sp.]|nr:marine proteobacterial sortase target protein [gamma proteobacterium symbiont of Taylorina sp.]